MKSENVEISVTGGTLTIKAETKGKSDLKENAYHIGEQRWDSFERCIGLTTRVLSDKAKAEFDDGVLTITLPRPKKSGQRPSP